MIRVHCFCFGHTGVQKHGLNFVRSISEHDDIALFPWDGPPPGIQLPADLDRYIENATRDPLGVAVGVGIPNRMPLITGHPRVAFIVWETTRIPEFELKHLHGMDQIWIPSTWGRDLLVDNGVDETSIRVVPEGVDTDLYRPAAQRNRDPGGPFRFLCVGKWEKRKGIDILLRAYSRAFTPREPVELVLHCQNPNRPGLDVRDRVAALNLRTPPVLLSRPMPEPQMPVMYNACDAFVLATRGEGWGLPVVEAMACGKPVIATGYGALLDLLNERNSFPIRVGGMIKVEDADNFDPCADYGFWADPDEDHLVHLLRHVYENHESAKSVGEAARRDVVARWTWKHAASRAWKMLEGLR